jgi:hypothetical protein
MIAIPMTLEEAGRKGKNFLPDGYRYVVPITRKQATREMRKHWPKSRWSWIRPTRSVFSRLGNLLFDR